MLHTIPHSALLVAVGLLVGVGSAQAVSTKTDSPTCGDYDYNIGAARCGTVTATFDVSTCRWTIEAIPTADFVFTEWSDGNTENPRTIDFSSEVDLDEDEIAFTAVFTMQLSICKTIGDYDFVTSDNAGGVITYEERNDSIILTATPNSGYTFVQWADGSAQNPRAITDYSDDEVTYYAAFISSTATKGQIDFWRKDGFLLTTTAGEGNLFDGVAFGGVTVFYDGQLMSSQLPNDGDDADLESRVDVGAYFIHGAYGETYDLAGKTCHIVYKNASCIPVATLDAVIPVLVDTKDDNVVVPNTSTGVHVLNGGIATLAEDQTIADLDIYAGGKAIIASNVTASSVTMRADAPQAFAKTNKDYPVPYPDLLVKGSLSNSNSNKINFDYILDYSAYYPFALPYKVNTSNVTYRSGETADEHFVLGYYDGAARSKDIQPAWKTCYDYADFEAAYYQTHMDIQPGVGYNIFAEPLLWNEELQIYYGGVIRFPMTVDLSMGGEPAKNIAVTQYDGPEVDKYNKNWNLVSIPYLSSYSGSITMSKDGKELIDEKTGQVKKLNYITALSTNLQEYEHEFVATATIYPFHCYLVQFEDDIDELVLESPNPAARVAAPAKRMSKQSNSDYGLMAGVVLEQNGQSDHTGLFIGEQYTNNYDVNADLAKMIGQTGKVKVYSLSGSQKLAYIAIPPANGAGTLETVIPLGYDSAKVGGEMTFAIDTKRYPELRESEDIIALELIDYVAGETTNLLENNYTCTAIQKADNSRFALNVRYIAKAPNTATGMDELELRATALPDGIYDLMGRHIDAASARNAGVYIIVRDGQVRKEVVR